MDNRGAVLLDAEQRLSTRDWVDMVLQAQELGALRTTMPSLDEESVSGNLNAIVKGNSPVWALTLARLQVFSQARFQWTRFERGERSDLFGTSELRVLERPWAGGTTADLLARMELDVTGAGNSYIRRLRRTRFGEDRLVRLRPDWVTIIMGSREDAEHPSEAADVELLGFLYTPAFDRSDQRAIILNPDEVAHYAPYPDPDAVFAGMSWVTPALRDVFADNASTIHKDRFFRNASTPNLAIRFDPSVTQEQVKAFKAIMESEHRGAWNAFKTLYLGGGADPVVIGKDMKEMDFSGVQGKAESRLAADAGVPPSWVGFSEGLQGSALNAGNFTAARRRYGDGTMQHLWSNSATSLEVLLDRPEGASLWFATRGIPFLRMDATDEAQTQSLEAQTITALVREGFTAQSVTDAVQNQDWSRLVHTGTLSVQLQPPATEAPSPNGDQEGARDALLGNRVGSVSN